MIARRRFCCFATLAALPAAVLLPACGGGPAQGGGPAPIRWDRETCTRCGMVLSDRRFAVQVEGGATPGHWNFDDIGCALDWIEARSWAPGAPRDIWVADLDSRGSAIHWLDARRAHFLAGRSSPMGYDYGARETAEPGSIDFEALRAALRRGREAQHR
ncbi:MAG: hypothetical protein U1F11_11085 [Steroidobacteraceae bacterium]